jgi:transcriptional regulator with XRE-family HTH domain/tetratricopeptide (TPR) repeat protein
MGTRFNDGALKRARLDLGMSQEEAAQQLRIEVRTYRRYESGEVNGRGGFSVDRAARRQLIHRMSDVFGLDEAELVVPAEPPRGAARWAVRWEHQLQPARSFVGRAAVLEALRAWAVAPRPEVRLTALVAAGGTGKSAICERLVRGLDRSEGGAFVWSYYSSERTELMLERLHRYLSGENAALSPGRRLTEVLEQLDGAAPHLLVFDGLEVVQSEGDPERAFGELTDPTLRRLLEHVAGGLGATRALVTSRFSLADLEAWEDRTVKTIRLEPLSVDEARALLAAHGLADRLDADRIVEAYGGHPLSLAMVANYVAKFARGRVDDPIIDPREAGADVPLARRLSRVLEHIERTLPVDEVACLRILCTFPMEMELAELSRLAGRLDAVGLSDREVRRAIGRLIERDLIYEVSERAVSAHPFVREHFADPALARAQFSAAEAKGVGVGETEGSRARSGASALDAARREDGAERTLAMSPRIQSAPSDLADLERLFDQAVSAGLGRAAFELYLYRIGGFGNLGLILGEMALGERLMRRLATAWSRDDGDAGTGLSVLDLSGVLYDWGLYATSLGDIDVAIRCHEKNCTIATHLSREAFAVALRALAFNQRMRGDLDAALKTLDAAIEAARMADSRHNHERGEAMRAAIHHARGDLDEAARRFEALRAQGAALVARSGVWEAELLLDLGERERVIERASENLRVCTELKWSGHAAQCHVVLGRARATTDWDRAKKHLRAATPWCERSGEVEVILLADQLAVELALAEGDVETAADRLEQGIRLGKSARAGLYVGRLERLRARAG